MFIMRSWEAPVAVGWLLLSCAPPSSSASALAHAVRRDATGLLESYDYIVVGGGVSGLTVANRLSQNPDVTVLVVEAGALDQAEDYITIPAFAGGAVGTKYDWNLTYAPNPDLGGRSVPIPVGKAVGGSSLLNRMIFGRGSKGDYDRWEQLGNEGWGWDGLLRYFRKSETFTPPPANQSALWNITYDPSAHGYHGPVQASFSNYFWPALRNFVLGLRELGAPTPVDGANGNAIGVFSLTHSQDPKTQTRCSARIAYYDSVKARQNLHLLTETQVTRLVSGVGSGTPKITGVETATSPESGRTTIKASREVLLAAGAIHTPQILQLSGIGDSSLLKTFNITTISEVPGVGRNFQDHGLLATVWDLDFFPLSSLLQTNASFTAEARAEYDTSRTGPYTTATGDYLAFLPAELITSNASSLLKQALAQDSATYLDPDTPATVAAGYAAQYQLLTKSLDSSALAMIELIWGDGSVLLGLLHPFSRGSVKIQSSDPFTAPLADSAFLRHPVDRALLVEAVKFVRRLMATQAIAPLSPIEAIPGSNVTSDASLESFVRENVATLYHPVGSCAIGTLEHGGCVDDQLRVFGTQGLRVVDGSLMPLLPAAHTMATVYAVAEKAADIILSGSSYS